MKKILIWMGFTFFLMQAVYAQPLGKSPLLSSDKIEETIYKELSGNLSKLSNERQRQVIYITQFPKEKIWAELHDREEYGIWNAINGKSMLHAVMLHTEAQAVYLCLYSPHLQLSPTRYIMFYGDEKNKPSYSCYGIQGGVSVNDTKILQPIFSAFEKLRGLAPNKNVDTDVVIEMHGDASQAGVESYIGRKHIIPIFTLTRAISTSKLKPTILALYSCNMGKSYKTLEALVQTEAQFILVSSNEACIHRPALASFLEHTDYKYGFDRSPEGRILAAFAAMMLPETTKGASFTHNLLAINTKHFRRNVCPVGKKFFESLDPTTYVEKYMKQNTDYYLRVGDIPTTGQLCEMVEKAPEFSQEQRNRAANLKQSLNQSIYKYFCWDAKKKKAYTHISEVPKDSECLFL